MSSILLQNTWPSFAYRLQTDRRCTHCCFYADDTEKLCQALDLQQLQQLCEAASAAAGQDAIAAVLADAVRALQSAAEREATEREHKKRETAKALKVSVYSSLLYAMIC